MLEIFPPVTRPRMFDVARPESLKKFALLRLGTLKSPKLWNKLVPLVPPGRVPPVMLYCVCPLGRETGGLTCVLRPDPVIGEAAWTREVREANNRTRKKPNVRQGISACFTFNAEPPLGVVPSPRKH